MAGDRQERWIDSLHEDHNGIVWTTKAELRAALASEPETRATPEDDIAAYDDDERGDWDKAELIRMATPEATADAAAGDGHAKCRDELRLARDLAGHRVRDIHDCFAMNCRDLGDEVRGLYEQLSRAAIRAAEPPAPSSSTSATAYLRDALGHWLRNGSSIEAGDDLRTAAAEWLRDIEEDDPNA